MYRAVAILILALLLNSLAATVHARLYRWVDADGNVHYSDRVPPDQVSSGRTELSAGGVRIKAIPPAKTPEEIQEEKELERLRLQQERLLEQQNAADLVLLRTFRSEDDIAMARDGKIEAVDVLIQVTRTNVRRHQDRLAGLRTKAGNLERTGKPVPKHLKDNISQTERTLRGAYATIIDKEEQKQTIRASFQTDLARFRQLKDLPETAPPLPEEEQRPLLHNIVTCSSDDECNRLWDRATEYVRENATTALQTSGANIFLTEPPTAEQDVSLILSRIDDEEGAGASLFLDLQCDRSQRGEKMCVSEQTQDIIKGFRPAIVGEDAPELVRPHPAKK